MTTFYLNLNKTNLDNLSPLSRIRIEDLIDDALETDGSNGSDGSNESTSRSSSISSVSSVSSISSMESISISSDLIHPPHIINIQNHEPLKLAKKKHYQPIQSAAKIQKRRGSLKPQGRPFNSNLNARFLLFNKIEDLSLILLNCKMLKIGELNLNNCIEKGGDTNCSTTTVKFNGLEINNVKLYKLSNEFNEHPFQLKSISFEKFQNSTMEIYNDLCSIFNILEFSFIKIIRNNKGKLIKFEIMSNISNNELNIDFIKKFITYPRYKSKMKIFLINKKFLQNIWFYNDERMLIWDLNNLNFKNTKVLINTDILI